jgi:hypothetical protein
MKKTNLIKTKHAAGGFQFHLSDKKGNTRLGDAKKKAIIEALGNDNTEGVYLTTTGLIKVQLLNGIEKII